MNNSRKFRNKVNIIIRFFYDKNLLQNWNLNPLYFFNFLRYYYKI